MERQDGLTENEEISVCISGNMNNHDVHKKRTPNKNDDTNSNNPDTNKEVSRDCLLQYLLQGHHADVT